MRPLRLFLTKKGNFLSYILEKPGKKIKVNIRQLLIIALIVRNFINQQNRYFLPINQVVRDVIFQKSIHSTIHHNTIYNTNFLFQSFYYKQLIAINKLIHTSGFQDNVRSVTSFNKQTTKLIPHFIGVYNLFIYQVSIEYMNIIHTLKAMRKNIINAVFYITKILAIKLLCHV